MSVGPFKFPEIPTWKEIKTAIFLFLLELAASVTTLVGMYVGSTTGLGACVYILSGIFWCVLTIKKRLWGLWPLNIAALCIAIHNLLNAGMPHYPY